MRPTTSNKLPVEGSPLKFDQICIFANAKLKVKILQYLRQSRLELLKYKASSWCLWLWPLWEMTDFCPALACVNIMKNWTGPERTITNKLFLKKKKWKTKAQENPSDRYAFSREDYEDGKTRGDRLIYQHFPFHHLPSPINDSSSSTSARASEPHHFLRSRFLMVITINYFSSKKYQQILKISFFPLKHIENGQLTTKGERGSIS